MGAPLIALVVLVVLSACSADSGSVAGQARSGDRKGYISGDGSVEQIPAASRDRALEVAGTTLDGQAWSSREVRGKVVVLNVWGSWCGPCVEEAPILQSVWAGYQKAGAEVAFMGLDVKESPESARAFVKARGITYPSLAYDGGRVVLGLRGKAPTVPATLVLDREGRLAARVSGPVTAATLRGLVDDVLAETGGVNQ